MTALHLDKVAFKKRMEGVAQASFEERLGLTVSSSTPAVNDCDDSATDKFDAICAKVSTRIEFFSG